ncbi:MAG TPA: MBL fold metallo-hydrolase [Vitreimonas sp.]|uniref:MBL fold metallo-hydrolase n=1 Tax=Vitreimonas sp. TaxID=3069702 RepID=UPI002D249A78|nr:MBL fold metallo-hydrolase [Vitreimonas sp.]HYD88048.1 MBL fold metallo-hydrolase [Vitreimonas sp.]
MITELVLAAAMAAESPQAPPARELAPGVHLIPGAILPGRGPDGNTVIFEAPDGLIVVDTGRHDWHSDAIVSFAATRQQPVAAIFNTHWHLDHSSGNGRMKSIFPDAPVYATRAIEGALAPGGFLVRNLERTRERAADPATPEGEREEMRIYLATMEDRRSLLPDVAIERARRMRIAGRRLDVRVTDGAVSAADIWLYDRRTRIAVLGDLVTLPAPFFESACPDAWRAELDAAWATPFRLAVPGHGEPMTRDQFNTYRLAFGAFIDCVNSAAEAARCASGWGDAVAQLVANDTARAEARAYADYYVGFLRQNGGASPDCAN